MSKSDKQLLVVVLGVIVFLIVAGIGGCAGVKEFNRYQRRADAANRTRVVRQEIKTAQQQAHVIEAQRAATEARADMREIEADGIRRAQLKINNSLTPLYVQHEYVNAMKGSGAEKVYIPTGNGGLPMVVQP